LRLRWWWCVESEDSESVAEGVSWPPVCEWEFVRGICAGRGGCGGGTSLGNAAWFRRRRNSAVRAAYDSISARVRTPRTATHSARLLIVLVHV
jgi:hypothetical protein